jgi:hypothetical protein
MGLQTAGGRRVDRPATGEARRRVRRFTAGTLVLGIAPVLAALPSANATAGTSSSPPSGVPASTLQRALAIVASSRSAGPLTVLRSTPAETATGAATSSGDIARTAVDARDHLGEVVVEIAQPSSGPAVVVAWDGTTTSQEWAFDPSTPTSTVIGPDQLATTVSRMAIAPGSAPTPSSSGPEGSTVQPDDTVGWCLVGAVSPALQGSPYRPLITFSGFVGFCTVSPVLITDTLILWQHKNGGYTQQGWSQNGGTDSDTDGSVSPCYSPWNVYYAFHTQIIVTLSYGTSSGYGYINSDDSSLNCDT